MNKPIRATLSDEEIQDIRVNDFCPTCSCQTLEFHRYDGNIKATYFKCDRCGDVVRYVRVAV